MTDSTAGPEVTFSRHARTVMRRRDVREDEVLAVARRPDRTYTSRGNVVFQGDKLAVVFDGDTWHVVTVLLRRDRGAVDRRWDDAEARAR